MLELSVYTINMRSQRWSARYQLDWAKCSQENFAGERMPAQTLLGISQLACPEMMVEIDVTGVSHE